MSKSFKGTGTQLQRGDSGAIEVFTKITEMKNVDPTGAKSDFEDVSNLDSPSSYKEWLPTMLEAGEITADGNFISDDAQQAALQADFNAQTRRNYKIVLPIDPVTTVTRGHWDFAAYVSTVDFKHQHDKAVTISIKLKIDGPRTFTAGA